MSTLLERLLDVGYYLNENDEDAELDLGFGIDNWTGADIYMRAYLLSCARTVGPAIETAFVEYMTKDSE